MVVGQSESMFYSSRGCSNYTIQNIPVGFYPAWVTVKRAAIHLCEDKDIPTETIDTRYYYEPP